MTKGVAVMEAWYLSILWGLVVPSQGLPLGGLLGSGSAKSGGGSDSGLFGSVLGAGGSLLGSGGDGGGDLVGSLLSAGGSLTGSGSDGGGGGDGGGGLLGSALGGGGGLLNTAGGLLGNTTGDILGGQSENGGLLGGALGGNALLGLPGLLDGNLLGLDGLLGGKSKEQFKWYNALNLEIVRGSWKVLRGSELVLNLNARATVNLPGMLSFLSGSSVEMNTTSHLAFVQEKPGDLQLVLKNCQDLVGGFTVKLPSSLIASLVNGFINTGLRTVLPSMICPIFQVWFGLVNMQLHALNDYVSFGLLRKVHLALSSVPFSTGQFSEIDLQDKPFPGTFLKWLLDFVGSVTSQKPS